MSFLLGPLGWLFVAISTPDRKRFRDCPACLSSVPRAATACSHCGRDLPPAPPPKRSANDQTVLIVAVGLLVIAVLGIVTLALGS